jgi:putative lipoprotein
LQEEGFVNKEWKLIQWESELLPENADNAYTVRFTGDGKVSGMGDCNRFSGSYAWTNARNVHKLHINQLASTRMACPDGSGEGRFFAALQKVDKYYMDGRLLVLNYAGSRMVFESE